VFGFLLLLSYFSFLIGIVSDKKLILITFSLLLALIAQAMTSWFTLQSFLKRTQKESHLIWLLTRAILGIPFILFSGCVLIIGLMMDY
jgi:hypothetical protein